jgi:hypothetical protein
VELKDLQYRLGFAVWLLELLALEFLLKCQKELVLAWQMVLVVERHSKNRFASHWP